MINKNFCVPISELANELAKKMDDINLKSTAIEMKIANRIYTERKKRKMNQSQFADFMSVSQVMISKWESGEYNFTFRQIVKIFDKLEIDVDITLNPEDEYIQNTAGSFLFTLFKSDVTDKNEKIRRAIEQSTSANCSDKNRSIA